MLVHVQEMCGLSFWIFWLECGRGNRGMPDFNWVQRDRKLIELSVYDGEVVGTNPWVSYNEPTDSWMLNSMLQPIIWVWTSRKSSSMKIGRIQTVEAKLLPKQKWEFKQLIRSDDWLDPEFEQEKTIRQTTHTHSMWFAGELELCSRLDPDMTDMVKSCKIQNDAPEARLVVSA